MLPLLGIEHEPVDPVKLSPIELLAVFGLTEQVVRKAGKNAVPGNVTSQDNHCFAISVRRGKRNHLAAANHGTLHGSLHRERATTGV